VPKWPAPKHFSKSLRLGIITTVLVAVSACSSGTGLTPAGQSSDHIAPAAATATFTATAAVPSPSSFTLVATGDVLLHEGTWAQARRDAGETGRKPMDFAPMLAAVRPYVRAADLGVCHLETPLAAGSGPFSGYPVFSGPPQVVSALKSTGYDVCSTASNHTLDQGTAGIARTLARLDAAGIAHAGSARTRAESQRITRLNANGVQVAFLSYAYGFNGFTYPGGQRWRANLIDVDQILADARRARAQGAQAVVLALHWGSEYQQTPNAQQLALAPKLARSGLVDLIISHHAHVVEPIQKIGSTWVVYGLGNLLASHADPASANPEELLVRFRFTRTGDGRYRATRAEYVPLLVTRSPTRVVDVRKALRTGNYGSAGRARLQLALKRTTRVVESMGGVADGLRPAAPPT